MGSDKNLAMNDAFHRAVSALAHLQHVALKSRCAAVWLEAQQAQFALVEALEHDQTEGRNMVRGSRP